MSDVPGPGERVVVVAGRHRGSRGVLMGVANVPGPSGATVRIAEIKRPRAGMTYVFEHEIRRAE